MAIDNSTISNYEGITSGSFTLEANAHVFKLLTTNVYNNIILAGIRELSTNAIDACIEADLPASFEVHLPVATDPTFFVRDYGPGLSEDTIISLYTTMGASSKRNSNSFNGQFGIGKLAPLAYASSFTIESFVESKHFSYLITIKDGIPVYLKLGESPSQETTGLKISYAVQAHDINTFIKEATYL